MGAEMKLVDNWRSLWRAFSMQAMGYAVTFIGWWVTPVGDDLKAAITVHGALAILAVLIVAGMIGRAIDQPSVTARPPEQ